MWPPAMFHIQLHYQDTQPIVQNGPGLGQYQYYEALNNLDAGTALVYINNTKTDMRHGEGNMCMPPPTPRTPTPTPTPNLPYVYLHCYKIGV